MTDVRHMSEIRDVRLAQEFAQMAAQGYIDQEFTMYGCAYWVNNERRYMISGRGEKIYDFIAHSSLKERIPTPIMTLTQVCPVPLGQQENIAQAVKRQLAKQLQESYPVGFFQQLQQLALAPSNDQAKGLLTPVQRALRGVFSEEKLGLFEGLMELAYEGKTLTKSSYEQFCGWIQEERANMEEDTMVKDRFEARFYGFAYEDQNGHINYVSNACKENVYRKKNHLGCTGLLMTPIFVKTYGYNYTYRLADALQDYKRYLKDIFNGEYMAMVKGINHLPTALDVRGFQEQLTHCYQQYGMLAGQAMAIYGRRWHIKTNAER